MTNVPSLSDLELEQDLKKVSEFATQPEDMPGLVDGALYTSGALSAPLANNVAPCGHADCSAEGCIHGDHDGHTHSHGEDGCHNHDHDHRGGTAARLVEGQASLAYGEVEAWGSIDASSGIPLEALVQQLGVSPNNAEPVVAVTANNTDEDDEPTGNIFTELSMEIGSFLDLEWETNEDVDYVRVELEAGVTYIFDAEGSITLRGTAPDLSLVVLNDLNVVVARGADFGLNGANALAIFTPETSGTYFLGLRPDDDIGAPLRGTYRVSAYLEEDLAQSQQFDASDLAPELRAFINVDDAPDRIEHWVPGQELTFEFDERMTIENIMAMRGFYAQLGSIINLDFVEEENALFNFTIDDNLSGNTLGQAFIISFSGNPISLARPGLETGVLIHEALHTLGLFHANEQENDFMSDIHGVPYSLQGSTFVRTADGLGGLYGGVGRDFVATGALVLDLEFLVALYGEDEINLADTNYVFDTSVDRFEGLHDGGGNDTITIVDEAAVGVSLDLQESEGLARAGLDVGLVNGDDIRIRSVFLTQSTVIENVVAAAGDDEVNGNTADNHFYGGAGSDTLRGEAGNDTLKGGQGADLLIGGEGIDVADLSDTAAGKLIDLNDDTIVTGEGDTLIGIEGVILGSGRDTLIGTNGADRFNTAGGNDLVSAGAGNDVVFGAAGRDTLQGQGGGDTLSGQAGDDLLIGGNARDILNGGTGADTLDGGTSSADQLIYTASREGVFVTLLDDEAGFGLGGEAEGDVLIDIENISGSGFDDFLTGNSLANRLWGRNGNDTLSGGAGNDRLLGGAGDDLLIGGLGADVLAGQIGDDTVSYAFATARVSVSLQTGVGQVEGDATDQLSRIENIIGSDFDDIIEGSRFANVLRGGAGNDTLTGERGADVFVIDAGDDVVTDFDAATGDSLDLTAFGFVDNDAVLASATELSGGVLIAGTGISVFLQGLALSDIEASSLIL